MQIRQATHLQRHAVWTCLVLVTGWPFVLNAASTRHLRHTPAATEAPGKAAGFVLQDQYNKLHNYVFPQDKVSVLLFADYQGYAQLERWIRPIYERYQNGIHIHGVADLSAVPGFLRGVVRNAFRKQLDYPVMLDWNGTVAERYAYESGLANLFVIDREGDVKLRLKGAATASKLQRVWHQIDALLTDPTPGHPFAMETMDE